MIKDLNYYQEKLNNAFIGTVFALVDESAKHQKHFNSSSSDVTHLWLKVTKSSKWASFSRLAIHRLIHEALKDDLITTLHALRIELK
ncbi:MAG TPA: BolA/IbaG family iron-sulfur metabolism protein [Alphaproteobacteria bacterium]|nr:BolA/IbaG family iron-sulfur metabolism protein [Alphaproteobacteria bacterium]